MLRLILILLLPLTLSAQLDSFPRFNELSGHIYIYKGDSLTQHIQTGDSTLNNPNHFSLGHFSLLYTYEVYDKMIKNKSLNKNDKIVKYIKDFPYKDMRVHHVAEHTSGLPTDYVKWFHKSVFRAPNGSRKKSITNISMINLINNEAPDLQFEMGTDTAFSNLNIFLLVRIMELKSNSFRIDSEFNPKDSIELSPEIISGLHSQGQMFIDSIPYTVNDFKGIGLPYNDDTYGHTSCYGSIENTLHLYFNSPYSAFIPNVSGTPGYHVEYYEYNGFTVFLFLNRVSEDLYFETELKEFINTQLLQ